MNLVNFKKRSLDSDPLNITSFGKALRIKCNTIYKCYSDVLSFYAQDGGASVHKNDIKTRSPGKQNVIEVPIFEESNFSEKMAIDEKHIGEDFDTIESNRDTGKIAILCNSYNFTALGQVLIGHPSMLPKVKSITHDFTALFKKLYDRLFPDAVQVGDKFYIIRHLMEANQTIRIKIRRKELQKRRETFKKFKGVEKLRLEECEWTGKGFKPRKFHYK